MGNQQIAAAINHANDRNAKRTDLPLVARSGVPNSRVSERSASGQAARVPCRRMSYPI
jgi:hypothetical protein